MSDNQDIIIAMLSEIKSDIKDTNRNQEILSQDLNQIKVDHKETIVRFKLHLSTYEADKVRLDKAIDYNSEIKNTVESKFDEYFSDILKRMTEVELKHREIETSIKETKYINKISRAIYLSGGSVITLMALGLAWFLKYAGSAIKLTSTGM